MTAARLALPLVALAVAAVAALPGGQPRGLRLSAARGALELLNSRDGAAAFSAPNMKPGDTAAGSLAITNQGSSQARLYLRSSPPVGGAIADVLQVRIAEGRVTVSTGTLGEVAGCHDLGVLAPGSTRTFRFTATWPPGARDNAYSGSTVWTDEHWFANEHGTGCVAGVQRTVTEQPAPRIAISHRRVRLVHHRARLRLRCVGSPGATCAGTVYLRPRTASARTRFRIRAGTARVVYVRVPHSLGKRRKAVAVAGRTTRVVTLIRRRRTSGNAPASSG